LPSPDSLHIVTQRTNSTTGETKMLDSNKAVVRTFIAALGSGDADTLAKVMDPDIQAVCTGNHVLSGTRGFAEVCGAAGMLGMMTKNGIEFTILNLTAEDDRVACEVAGTSVLATGQEYNNQYHFLFFLRDGKVVRMMEYMDSLLVETLLGPLVRAAAAAAAA